MTWRVLLPSCWLLGVMVAGCFTPTPRPISESITVHITTTDPTHPIRFALDVTGGPAELRAPQMRGWATDARLTAGTPADVILRPGTTAASFRTLNGGRLKVTAAAPSAHLAADGARVRIASTETGLAIRDY